MLVIEFADEKLTLQVGTLADGGYRSVLAPLLGSSVFLAAASARSGKKGGESSAIALGLGAAVGAAVAHYGSKTTEWTFDKTTDSVTKRSAPFWRSFSASPAQLICSCSQLVPKNVAEGSEVSDKESGLMYKKSGSLDGTSSSRVGELLLLLTGRRQVPICTAVPPGQAFMLADFLTFDLSKVTKTELTPEEMSMCRKMYQAVDANGDGVLEPYELRQIELVMPQQLAVLGSASPVIRSDAHLLRWTTRTGSFSDHMQSLDVNGDGLLQFEEFERWVKLRKVYQGNSKQTLAELLAKWIDGLELSA